MPRSQRVLIVDDSPAVRERLETALAEIAGVRIVGTAADAATAVRLTRDLAPDLVVLDLRLRDSSGLCAAFHIKKLTSPPAIAVFTSHGFAGYRERCRVLGVDHFFDKATDFDQLVTLVRRNAADPGGRGDDAGAAAGDRP